MSILKIHHLTDVNKFHGQIAIGPKLAYATDPHDSIAAVIQQAYDENAQFDTTQFHPPFPPIHDNQKQPLQTGNSIQSIESGWHGQIRDIELHGDTLLLRCQGINWLTGTLDADDTQWFDPFDVVKVARKPNRNQSPHPANFL